MEKLKFSVITVSYNQGEFIRDTIESVLDQNYRNFEHIIIDAGSTDNTLEVLKSYPHLYWTSEPDRGQSHGLNKGFGRATGDVIAWLNSDDWYAPNIFHEVAAALEEYPVLLAPSAETNREGEVQFINPNVPRTRFQQLKYWVYFSWMIQPSIFFKRSVLDEVIRPDGEYLDESLYYTMDYDLWMRIAEKYPFNRRIDTLCSYYRYYDENKTGKEGEAAQWENSRVFRRYSTALCQTERKFSVIIPVTVPTEKLTETLMSLARQQIQDVEVVLVRYGNGIKKGEIRKFALDVRQNFRGFQVKGVYTEFESFLEAINAGVNACSGEILTFLSEGAVLSEEYLLQAHNIMVNDGTGVIVPVENEENRSEALGQLINGVRIVTPGKVVEANLVSPFLTVKKTTFLDLGGFRSSSEVLAVKEFLLRAVYHCWYIVCDAPLSLSAPPILNQQRKIQAIFDRYIIARIVIDIDAEYQRDDYMRYIHTEHRQSFSFPTATVAAAQKLLERAPPSWQKFNYLENYERLKDIVATYPLFSPAYCYLADLEEKRGDRGVAQTKAKLEKLLTEEKGIL